MATVASHYKHYVLIENYNPIIRRYFALECNPGKLDELFDVDTTLSKSFFEFVERMETEFATHDINGSGSCIGFLTYEIGQKTWPELLKKHLEFMVANGVCNPSATFEKVNQYKHEVLAAS